MTPDATPDVPRSRAITLSRALHGPRAMGGALALFLVAVGAYAAAPNGPRAFRVDDSLRIVSPAPLAKVSTPFTVSWEGPPGEYAVFVDAAPVPVGGSIRDLGGEDCQEDKACRVRPAQLSTLGVFVTTDQKLEIPNLITLSKLGSTQEFPVHRLTIVPLGQNQDRQGTASWTLEFHAEKQS